MKMMIATDLKLLQEGFYSVEDVHSVVVFGDNVGLESDGLRDHHRYYDHLAILAESLNKVNIYPKIKA